MSRHRSCKSLIITDDEEVQADELNPFSFKEFLRLKNQDQDQEQDQDQDQEQDQDQDQEQDQAHSESCSSSSFDPDVHKCFFSEPKMIQQEEEDEDRGWGFQCSVDGSSSPLSEEETRFCSKPEVNPKGGGDCEGDDETSMTEPINSFRRRSHIQLEENVVLRRTIKELQRRSDAKERRVQELSEELLQRRRQDEKEAEDLESMVHSVEQNLHLMTKRALKAENNVCKLKAELQQLQMEVESLRSENDGLKAAESQVVMTMRQTAQVASEYLNKMASHAHSSIRQLLGEAETLRLVSHLLRSIDKMSEC